MFKASFDRRSVTLAALLVVLTIAMTLLVSLVVRLQVDRVPDAMATYESVRSDIRGLEAVIRGMTPPGRREPVVGLDLYRHAAEIRLDRLQNFPCAQGGELPGYGARIAGLRRDFAALASLSARGVSQPSVETQELAALMELALADVDRSAHACFRAVIDYIWLQAQLTKANAGILILLIAITVVPILLLRRRDERQLRDQLLFNEQLIDAIPLPLSLRSPQGEFMLVNRAFEEKHAVRREKVLGLHVRKALPAFDAAAIAEMDARAVDAAEPVEEFFHVLNDHVDRHVLVRVLALRRADDSVLGTVGIQTDVTALRRKEAQLIEINSKLSQLSVKMIDAQEDERRRIARDLHDQVGQILTALKLQLASLARRPRIDNPAVAFATPIDLAEEALRHTRDLSASLHPHLLDDLGIEPALNWLIDRFIRPSVPQVELRCRLDPARGPAASELVAFRVVQEALTNVVRHAGATRAGVMLESANGQLTIEVIDDGVGFDAGLSWFDLQRTTSLGVTSMRDRVQEIGGDLHMDSRPGAGTSLRVHLPWAMR